MSAGPSLGENLAVSRWLRPGLAEPGWGAEEVTHLPCPRGKARAGLLLSEAAGEASGSLELDGHALRAWGLSSEALVWPSHQVLLRLPLPESLRPPLELASAPLPGGDSELVLSFFGGPASPWAFWRANPIHATWANESVGPRKLSRPCDPMKT